MLNDPMGDLVDLQKEAFYAAHQNYNSSAATMTHFEQSYEYSNGLLEMNDAWHNEVMSQDALYNIVGGVEITGKNLIGQYLNGLTEEYLDVKGHLLNEVKVKYGDAYSYRMADNDIQHQIDVWSNNDGSPFWADAERKLATRKDPAIIIYEAAKFYAGGELGGALFEYTGLGSLISRGFSNLVGKFASKATPAIGKYSVYQGLENGIVKYIGITSRDVAERFSEHLASETERAMLRYEVIPGATSLTRDAARVMEQNLLNHYGLDNLLNKINSIAPKNWAQYGVTP
jgi:hypothetical protein